MRTKVEGRCDGLEIVHIRGLSGTIPSSSSGTAKCNSWAPTHASSAATASDAANAADVAVNAAVSTRESSSLTQATTVAPANEPLRSDLRPITPETRPVDMRSPRTRLGPTTLSESSPLTFSAPDGYRFVASPIPEAATLKITSDDHVRLNAGADKSVYASGAAVEIASDASEPSSTGWRPTGA